MQAGPASGNLDGPMPVYEFRCHACGRKFTSLVGMIAEPGDDRCPHCGGDEAERLVSKFSRGRNEDERIDAIADRLDLAGDPESPAEMRAVARELGKALDEDASDEMEEMLEADFDGTSEDD